MKVLDAEMTIRALKNMKKYLPFVYEGRLIYPHKVIIGSGIDRFIELLEEKSFEVDISGEANE